MTLIIDLTGRVAVVTGASRGIGAETARTLAGAGAAVALVGRDEAALAAVADEIVTGGGRAVPVAADCTSESDLDRMVQIVGDRFGPPDTVIAFAGGNGSPVPTAQETAAHWREVLESDLTATFLTVSALLPGMPSGGGGSIVTMSSAAARQAARSNAAYAAAKAGVIALTRHLAGELAPRRIRVNCLAPSSIENERMRTAMSADQLAQLGESFPLGRIGQPADVAAATLFLASDAASWITGVTLDVAGGRVML